MAVSRVNAIDESRPSRKDANRTQRQYNSGQHSNHCSTTIKHTEFSTHQPMIEAVTQPATWRPADRFIVSSPTYMKCTKSQPTNAQCLHSMQLAQPDTWPFPADRSIAKCHTNQCICTQPDTWPPFGRQVYCAMPQNSMHHTSKGQCTMSTRSMHHTSN